MKGTVRENLGASRYIVGVRSAVQPLADEIEKYTKLYQATIPKITEAYGVLNERRAEYQAALAAVTAAAAEYEICRQAFSVSNCIDAGNAACNAAYLEADAACLEIESGIGECDADCQRDRLRCHETAVRVREACLAVVAIDCAEAEYQHILECQTTHSPLIAKAQAAALALLPGMQDALYNLQHEQALQWQLARKLNELEGIDQREQQITCYIAQWDEALAVGDEVELARTPNGRTVITRLITAPTPCLHDARVLPSGHLFVNAAIFPGFETWRPSWRVGTVLEVLPPKLRVQFAPAIMVGSLGTLYSKTPLDCTPPQCYFDGIDPKEAEADIRAARSALSAAKTLLLEAVAVRTACVDVYDQAWMDQCYGTGVEACDAEFGAAMEQPTLDKGACYDEAQGNCEAQTTAGLEACTLAYQPAIDEAQGEVDAATLLLDQATSDLTDAQNALAVIEAEIQACIDAINTQEWLDNRWQELVAICANNADSHKQFCLDNGGTEGECQTVHDAFYADCLIAMEDVLPINQQSAMDNCQTERQEDVDAAQVAIDAAYTAVLNAEIALGQVQATLELAQQALTDCQGEWVLADCLEDALQFCDDTYALAEDTYTQRRAACYQEAMAECDRQRDEAIEACYAANADAIDGAQQTVDEAVRALEIATAGRYNPADPLILDVPVAHCAAAEYQVEDEVLIDFPVRSGETAMAVWDSRRVIGWATETRSCCCGGFDIEVGGDLKSWYLLRRMRLLTPIFRWEEINTPDQTLDCDDNALYLHSEPTQGENQEVQFFGLGPIANGSIGFEVKVTLTGSATVTIAQGAEQADSYEMLFEQSADWTRYCYNYLDWIGPTIGLWTDPGSTAQVWIRSAKGPAIGFCETTGGDDLAALEILESLRSARDEASAAYQLYLAQEQACYDAVAGAFNDGLADCIEAYPRAHCYRVCLVGECVATTPSSISFIECREAPGGTGDTFECQAQCGITIPELEPYYECLESINDAYDAGTQHCNEVYSAENKAQAAAALVAAQDALDAYFNLHPC